MQNNLNIGIIGAGTASAVSLLSIINAIRTKGTNFKINVTCIHDPDVPITHVGESMTPIILLALHEVINFNPCEDMRKIDATYRWASKYFWERANNNNFYVRYREAGIHANSEKFAKFVLDRLVEQYPNFRVIEDRVIDIINTVQLASVKGSKGTYNFDYVIDATGTPTAKDLASGLYEKPYFESVNSVILYPEFKKYEEDYTSATVHDNGWMFGVPLRHRKAFGYLYNNNITSKEEAFKDFAKIKDIEPEKCRAFSWNQYYRKEIMVNRVLYIGNKMYFFEPHQAIPLHYYYSTLDFFIFIINQLTDLRKVNEELNHWGINSIENIQDLIALNYVGKNQIQSPFWKYAKEHSQNRLKKSDGFKHFLQETRLNLDYPWLPETLYPSYWVHASSMMNEYISGFKIDLEKLL